MMRLEHKNPLDCDRPFESSKAGNTLELIFNYLGRLGGLRGAVSRSSRDCYQISFLLQLQVMDNKMMYDDALVVSTGIR
jgi:hypothetical protein